MKFHISLIDDQIAVAKTNYDKYVRQTKQYREKAMGEVYNQYVDNPTNKNALKFAQYMDASFENDFYPDDDHTILGTNKKYKEIFKSYQDAVKDFNFDVSSKDYLSGVEQADEMVESKLDSLSSQARLYQNQLDTLKEMQTSLKSEIKSFEDAERIAVEEAQRKQEEADRILSQSQSRKRQVQKDSTIPTLSKAELEKQIKEKQDLINRLNSKYPVEIDETVEAFKNVKNLRNNQKRSEFITKFNKTNPEFWKDFKTDEKIGRKTITSDMIQDFAKNNIKDTLFSTEKYKTVASQLEAKIQESLQVEQKA